MRRTQKQHWFISSRGHLPLVCLFHLCRSDGMEMQMATQVLSCMQSWFETVYFKSNAQVDTSCKCDKMQHPTNGNPDKEPHRFYKKLLNYRPVELTRQRKNKNIFNLMSLSWLKNGDPLGWRVGRMWVWLVFVCSPCLQTIKSIPAFCLVLIVLTVWQRPSLLHLHTCFDNICKMWGGSYKTTVHMPDIKSDHYRWGSLADVITS